MRVKLETHSVAALVFSKGEKISQASGLGNGWRASIRGARGLAAGLRAPRARRGGAAAHVHAELQLRPRGRQGPARLLRGTQPRAAQARARRGQHEHLGRPEAVLCTEVNNHGFLGTHDRVGNGGAL